MRMIYVLYDDTCGFCCRCADWLKTQSAYFPVLCMPAGANATKERFPALMRRAEKSELVVVDDQGGVYREADAWVAVLWALRGYRSWAKRLTDPTLRPLARNAFEFVSSNRHKVSEWFGLQPRAYVARTLLDRYGAPGVPKCADTRCEGRPPGGADEGVTCPGCWQPVSRGREFCPHCLARMLTDAAATS